MADQDSTIPTETFRDAGAVWWWFALVGAVTMFAIMVLIVADVVGRYFLNSPVKAAYELTEVMMAIVVIAALPLATIRGKHITVGLFDFAFKGLVDRVRQVLLSLIGAFSLAYTSWRLLLEGSKLAEYGDYTTHLHMPRAPLAYFMAAMGIITCVGLLFLCWRQIKGRKVITEGQPEDL
jgi:TRAP-type transport system small permease protein